MQSNEEYTLDGGWSLLPWVDVEASRRNQRLQERHPPARGQAVHRGEAVPCPQCGTPALELSWFYFHSPAPGGANAAAKAGWSFATAAAPRSASSARSAEASSLCGA